MDLNTVVSLYPLLQYSNSPTVGKLKEISILSYSYSPAEVPQVFPYSKQTMNKEQLVLVKSEQLEKEVKSLWCFKSNSKQPFIESGGDFLSWKLSGMFWYSVQIRMDNMNIPQT